MSKEREFLKKILAYMCAEYLVITEFEMITQIEDTVKEIQNLLAQPEQKREPLSDEEIYIGFQIDKTKYLSENSFIAGVRWAEQQYGIGVDDE